MNSIDIKIYASLPLTSFASPPSYHNPKPPYFVDTFPLTYKAISPIFPPNKRNFISELRDISKTKEQRGRKWSKKLSRNFQKGSDTAIGVERGKDIGK